jgi:hypothetical protein
MRDELCDKERDIIRPILPNEAALRASRGRPAGPQWHFLGLAVGRPPSTSMPHASPTVATKP